MGRTLGQRDREIIYRNAGKKCENCGKPIEIWEMEIGHKTAWSRGGGTTYKNSVCLCAACNRLQGTDSWATFQKKQGKEDNSVDIVRDKALDHVLKSLKIKQLKELCDDLDIARPKSRNVGAWFREMERPSRAVYIKRIIKSDADIEKIKSLISAIK